MADDVRGRAEAMCSGVPEASRERAVELAENVLWMEAKLADARRVIGKSSVAIPYDNGGGQRGVRRNPAYDGYNSLMSSYAKAVRQLTDMLGCTQDAGDAACDLDSMLTGGETRNARARRR